MKWSITMTPVSAALNAWTWTAVRADQENVLMGDQAYATKEAARTSAHAAIQEYEDSAMVVRDATVTEEFTPEGVDPEAAPLVVE